MKTLLLAALPLFLFTACDALWGAEIGRIEINEASVELKETTVKLQKRNPLSLWADLDFEYEGELQLYYTIEVWQGNNQISGQRLNGLTPTNVTNSLKTEVNGHFSERFSGEIGEVELVQNGNYVVKASISTSDNATLKLKKAHLVLRQ